MELQSSELEQNPKLQERCLKFIGGFAVRKPFVPESQNPDGSRRVWTEEDYQEIEDEKYKGTLLVKAGYSDRGIEGIRLPEGVEITPPEKYYRAYNSTEKDPDDTHDT